MLALIQVIGKDVVDLHILLDVQRNLSNQFLLELSRLAVEVVEVEYVNVGSLTLNEGWLTLLQHGERVIRLLSLLVLDPDHLN